MGLSGTLDYLSDKLSDMKKPKKLKQITTVHFKVRMDCDGCEHKAKSTLKSMKGVRSVVVDRKQQKVSITGVVDGPKLLKKFKQKSGMTCQLWPYVPYYMVANPYISQAYDKKAPANHVRKVDPSAPVKETTMDPRYLTIFSDEDPNACSIM
ncbi:hypothetical protein QQ045_031975 [Rhodiola kirilowii]